MKISVDQGLLTDAIKSIQRINGATVLSAQVQGNFLKLTGVNNSNSAALTVACKKETKDEFTSFSLDMAVFLQAIAKRSGLCLEIGESNVLATASGGFKADLVTQHYDIVEVVPASVKDGSDGKAVALKSSFLRLLEKHLPKMELKPLLTTYSTVPVGVRASKEGTFIAAYDYYQAAYFEDSTIKGKVDFILPNSIFSILHREIKDQDYSLVVTETVIYAFNEVFEIAFAVPQEEGDTIPFEKVVAMHDALKSMKLIKLTMTTSDLTDALDNARGIYEKDAVFTFKAKGSKVKVDVASAYGKVSVLVNLEKPAKQDVEFSCDFNFFTTMVARAPAKLELEIDPGPKPKLMLIKNESITHMMTLV